MKRDLQRIVEGLAQAFEELDDKDMTMSTLRVANLCTMSWGGNQGTAAALRRLAAEERSAA